MIPHPWVAESGGPFLFHLGSLLGPKHNGQVVALRGIGLAYGSLFQKGSKWVFTSGEFELTAWVEQSRTRTLNVSLKLALLQSSSPGVFLFPGCDDVWGTEMPLLEGLTFLLWTKDRRINKRTVERNTEESNLFLACTEH